MASLIGALKVTLGLETAAFETGATRAARRADALGTDMEKLGNRVGTITKVLGAAAIAAVGSQVFQTMSGLVKQGLDYASALGEQAQQLGVTTKELQEYRYAASQAGVEQDAMDKSLAKLTVTIGKAAAGAKGPAAAFKELGVSLTNADGSLLTAGEAFPKIAEGLSKIPDPASRAKIEVELFGKAGQQLDTLLAGGAGAVNNLRNAAHELGIVLSDKQIQNADDTADKLAAIQKVLSAKIAGVVADNTGAILALANAFEQIVKWAGEAIEALKKFKAYQGLIDSKIMSYKPFVGADVRQMYADRADMYQGIIDNMDGKGPRVLMPGGSTAKPSGPRNATGFGAPLKLNPGKLGTNWSGVAVSKKYTRANYAGQGLVDDAGPFGQFDAGGIRDGMDAISKASIEAQTSVGQLGQSFREMGDSAVNNTARASDGAGQMQASFEESAQGIIGALDRVAGSFQGGGFLDKLSAFLGLAMQIKGVFFAGSGGSTGGGSGHSGSNRLPGRAHGGPVLAGRAYMVGERGPELFMPGSNGGIVPNGGFSGGSGGGGVTNHFTGNLMTAEFWAMIQAGDRNAAQAGARGGEARVIRRQARRVY